MRSRLGVLLAAATLIATTAVAPKAHHSVPGQFDMSKPMTLKGVIAKIDWINPHIYLHLEVKDAGGGTSTWALATLPTAMMRRAGLTRETLQGKPGEEVTIRAIPARDGTKHLGWIQKITYADGRDVALAGQ
jgi:hypothetical protein